ncbi:MAG TPA: ADYC domain-containing protein [Archangium sp.]|nr:ADYC domain-containing protein [Archangium sp.]
MNDRFSRRTAMSLMTTVALLTGGWAQGCGPTTAPEEEEPTPLVEQGASVNCPGGSPCDGDDNGPGIYVGSAGSNCLWLTTGLDLRFCPESFQNIPARHGDPERVRVKGRSWWKGKSTEIISGEVRVRLGKGKETALLAVSPPDTASPSQLGFVYLHPDNAGKRVHAQGKMLSKLTLLFAVDIPGGKATIPIELSFEETAIPGDSGRKLYRYQGAYNNPMSGLSGPFCATPADSKSSPTSDKSALEFSLLAGHQVNGETGVIQKSGNSVTLACVSGAIATCMEEWRYYPWNKDFLKANNADPTLLLGACIQGKRAAYFAHPNLGSNDFRSYTVEDTQVSIQDDWINTEAIADSAIEAIWDDKGAVCFNEVNQRRPDRFKLKYWNPQALEKIPDCTPEHRKPNRLIIGKASN